jgi:hypothetical protein
MARRIPILNVIPSATAGAFVVGATTENTTGDWTAAFQGKYYRQTTFPNAVVEWYTLPSAPAGYVLIEATQFDVVENASYAGRYTVFTKPSAVGASSSTFTSPQTTVRVAEVVPSPLSIGDTTSGFITNVSTYYVYRRGTTAVIVPPSVTVNQNGLDFVGRSSTGWGEAMNQNYAYLVQNFASPTAPDPVQGMLWYDTSTGLLKVYDSTWHALAAGSAALTSYRHAQPAASAIWSINHGLGVTAPFVVEASFFVDVGGGIYKPILPGDFSYVDANHMTVTFSASYAGYALIHA